MKRTLLVLLLASGLIVLAGLGLLLAWPRVPLDSELTTPAAPPARLVCYGHVDCRHGPLLLQPTRAGRVVQVFVKEGQTVSKDTPLLQLDDRLATLYEEEAEVAVRAAKLQLTKAQSGLAQYQAKQLQAKAALRLAENKLRMARHFLTIKQDMHKDGLTNQGHLDLARDQVKEAEVMVMIEQYKLAELNAADPAVEAKLAQLQLERSETMLRRAAQEREEMALKAPVAGTVLRLNAQEGDLAAPTAPRPAVFLAPVGDWIVRSEVAQEFAGCVREGLAVQVEDEVSGVVLAQGAIGVVGACFLPRQQLSLNPTSINTGLVLECLITLREGHAPLRLGQRVRVRILAD